jgi:hypothetical protein
VKSSISPSNGGFVISGSDPDVIEIMRPLLDFAPFFWPKSHQNAQLQWTAPVIFHSGVSIAQLHEMKRNTVTVGRWDRWHEETDLEMMRRVGHT